MEKDTRLIEDFLFDLLSNEDKKAFQKRLESDKAFREKFEFEKQLFSTLNEDSWNLGDGKHPKVKEYKSVLDSNELSELRQSLDKVGKTYHENTLKPNKSKKFYFYAAAAVIAILIIFQFMFNMSPSGQKLYYSYVDLQNLPSFVTRNSVSEDEAVKAEELFKEKKYAASIELFQDVLEEQPKDPRIFIYLGIALTESEDYKKAVKVFDDLIASSLIDAQKGYWYKALLYLKMDKKDEVLELLNKIMDEKLYNYKKAERLIKELS